MSRNRNVEETESDAPRTIRVRARDNTKRGLSEGTKRFWFKKGNAGGGRPVGSKSLKEFARDYLLSVDDETKKEFLASLPQDLVWRMAEGNPHSTEDVRHTVAPTPIMDLGKVDSSPTALHDSPPVSLPSQSAEGATVNTEPPVMLPASPSVVSKSAHTP